MVRRIIWGGIWTAAVMAVLVICSPVLLIFSTGNDGELTIWNFVGMAWLVMLILVGKTVNR